MAKKHLRAPSRHAGTPDATAFFAIQYEPVGELGAGGVGTVTLARPTTGPQAGTFVAIKRLFPHLEQDREIADAFLDEVWLISSLHHPNVVEPYDWGRDKHGSFLVMQFVPGDSLRALVCARELEGRPLPIPVVVEVIACAAAGLHAAHELKSDAGDPLNLVHRDASPANVLVGYDGSVKLIDFGVATAAGKLVKTQSGLIKGKFGYMSPEQMRGEPLDRRSDVFALGVLAWEALTLCRLYRSADEYEVFRMICEEAPVPPSELRRDVPEALDRIVLRCLAKDPARRFASCADLLDALAPLRVSREVAREMVAHVSRESMPERLRWIEQITGAPVTVGEVPLAVAPDATLRHPTGVSAGAQPHRAGDFPTQSAVAAPPHAPPGPAATTPGVPSSGAAVTAPVPVPALPPSPHGAGPAPRPSDDRWDQTVRTPRPGAHTVDEVEAALRATPANAPAQPPRPRAESYPLGTGSRDLAALSPAARRAERIRSALLASVLVLVGIVASLVGVWLGRQ